MPASIEKKYFNDLKQQKNLRSSRGWKEIDFNVKCKWMPRE